MNDLSRRTILGLLTGAVVGPLRVSVAQSPVKIARSVLIADLVVSTVEHGQITFPSLEHYLEKGQFTARCELHATKFTTIVGGCTKADYGATYQHEPFEIQLNAGDTVVFTSRIKLEHTIPESERLKQPGE